MATRRLSMNRIREVLTLRWECEESVRRTAAAVGLSRSVVSKVTSRVSRGVGVGAGAATG